MTSSLYFFGAVVVPLLFLVPSPEAVAGISFPQLLTSYDPTVRPHASLGPTGVNVSFVLHSFIVDDVQQTVKVTGLLVQEWEDLNLRFGVRLGAPALTAAGRSGEEIKSKLWLPDILPAETSHLSVSPHNGDFLRILPEGRLQWSQYISFDFPCEMDFTSYPMGKHICILKLQSFGYEVTELVPSWAGDNAVEANEHNNLHYQNSPLRTDYLVHEITMNTKTIATVYRTKKQLHAEIEVWSMCGWSVKHTVIPMSACVLTAYLIFFINPKAIAARMTTCSLMLLTAAVFHESTYRDVPRVHYTMALEIFTGTCLTFIFLSALETVIVDTLNHLPNQMVSSSANASYALEVLRSSTLNKTGNSSPQPHNRLQHPRSSTIFEHPDLTDERHGGRVHTIALWMDRCMRILYPLSFIAFNAIFWILYY